ncbi:hypothetical protein [Kitasatospora sp. P5_F3]
MVIVRATLVDGNRAPGTEAAARTIEDALWAHATPEFGLEHIRALDTPTGIDMLLFLRADGPQDALVKANGLILRALDASALARYTAALHLS